VFSRQRSTARPKAKGWRLMLRGVGRNLARMRLRIVNGLVSGVLFVVCVCAPALMMAQNAANPSAENLLLIKDAAQAIAAGDLQRGESELSVVLAAAPDDFRALDLLGVIRAQQQREAEAEKLLKRAIEIKPDFASAHVSLGMLYVQMAKPDDAVPQFEEALRLDPERTDARASLVSVWHGEARAAAGENDLEKALALLLQARKENPKDADVLYDFGMVALRMSLFADAAQAFQAALDLPNDVQNDVRKDDGNALYGLGRAQMSMANFEGARVTFNRYCQVRPADASGHFAFGMTLEALQRVGEARGEFEKSIELQPAQTESFFQLGRMELEAGDLRAAEAQFNRVLKRDPHHAGALAGMGRSKFEQKEYEQAVDLLEKAVTANAGLREAHYYLGMSYGRVNRKDDSEKELAIASRLEHEEVEQHQNMLRIINPAAPRK